MTESSTLYTLGAGVSLVLASASPRRHELLSMLGLKFHISPAHIDEEQFQAQSPEQLVSDIASAKGAVVSALEEHHQAWVLAADTIVVAHSGEVLGKPKDKADCLRMLGLLSGSAHHVHTALSLQNFSLATSKQVVCTTEVVFKPLSAAECEWYADSGEPYDKAGAYGAQGIGSAFIERINGSYSNVVGLPLTQLVTLLRDEGIVA